MGVVLGVYQAFVAWKTAVFTLGDHWVVMGLYQLFVPLGLWSCSQVLREDQ